MKHIVMFSGGKDSTAMLLLMIEKDMQIDEIIYCNTGKEYPEVNRHILKLEEYINRPIKKILPEETFDFIATKKIINKDKPEIKREGMGWPTIRNRWCTYGLKTKKANQYLLTIGHHIKYIGIASDEYKRSEKSHNDTKKSISKYPLVEWNMTEKDALNYCYSKGFTWDGLYDIMPRLSCYLCPLQRLSQLEYVYNHYNLLWQEMKEIDRNTHNSFRNDYTLSELERIFSDKKSQLKLF